MSIIVSKFGGSSIADASRFRRVRKILASRPDRRYIVLSAPGRRNACDEKITDLLCRSNQLYSSGADGREPLLKVKSRFRAIVRELSLDVDPDALLSGLDSDVLGSADLAASRGEYLCARIFSDYANIPFADAAQLILFDGNGRIQRDAILHRVRGMANRLSSAIIPGFYGSLPDGTIKTFSRGGSDITGALLAAALRADIYENWTDVDGLMSADPAICPEAVCHAAVSYRQMRLLAKAGAQVLHPYCLEPVCEAGIPTLLKNTFAPERPGTYISDHVRDFVPCVCTLEHLQAVETASLGAEARAVASGLQPERYTTSGGRDMLVLQGAGLSIGRTVNLLSAFCLPSMLRAEAIRRIDPVAFLHLDSCSRFLVAPEQTQNAVRVLHELVLFSGLRASRNPADSCERCRSLP